MAKPPSPARATRPPTRPSRATTASIDRFDWRLVRSFLAVLDAGSLMGAARQLQAQQPTLSRHVAELEAQLGTPLFERTGRGVLPSPTALAIADAARQMQAGAEALSRQLAGQRNRRSGTVRLSTSRVAATWLVPPLLAELRRLEPGIEVELVATDQITNLLRREADIALRMVRPAQASLVARKLGEIGLGAYAHSDYLQRAGIPQQAADLLQHELVGFATDDSIERGFAAQGLVLPRSSFGLRTDDQVAYVHLVAAGGGIGFLTHYAAQQWPALQRVLPQLPVPSLPCWLAVHREIRSSPLVRRVVDFLAEAVPPAMAGQR